jgi:hypothetical protein
VLSHYGLNSPAIQAGKANENGDVEQRHHRFKRAVEQALLLRGRRDFADREEYAAFLASLLAQLNAGRRERLADEWKVLRNLPGHRLEGYTGLRAAVDSGSLIHVERNVYSVNSRLIGEEVEVRLHADHLDVWYGQGKPSTPRAEVAEHDPLGKELQQRRRRGGGIRKRRL